VKHAALPVVFFLAAAVASAQSTYVIVDSVRLPAESFVGDPVELRYTIRTTATPATPDEWTNPPWGVINAVRVSPTDSGFDLRMTVTPFETGTLTLPPLDLGAIRVEGLSFVVLSILESEDASLRGVRGPQLLPGTRSALLLLGILGAFVLAMIFYGAGPGRRHLASLLRWYRARVPYKQLLSCVETLDRDIRRFTMRDFYIELMAALQAFLDSRLETNCLAATSTELIRILPELERSCGAVPGTTTPLEEVIRAADSVKFAGLTVRRKKRQRHLVIVRAVAVELEAHRRRLRKMPQRRLPEVDHVGV